MMEFVKQLALPHWLIIAGGALVIFGVIGIIVRRLRGAWFILELENTERTPKMNVHSQDGADGAP